MGVKKNGSKKKVGVKKIIKKNLNESGVKNKNPFKSKYKGNPFIFICAERQTDRQTNTQTDRQTNTLNRVVKTSRLASLEELPRGNK